MPIFLGFCSLHRAGCAGWGFPPMQSKDAGGVDLQTCRDGGAPDEFEHGRGEASGILQRRGLF